MALDVLHLSIYNQSVLKDLDQTSLWREIARRNINGDPFSAMARKTSLNTIKIEQIEQSRAILEKSPDDPRARFTAKGAAVFLILPKQEFPVVEYEMGQDFNDGTTLLVAENLHEKVLDRLLGDGLMDKDTKRRYLVRIKQTKELKLAREICGAIGMNQEDLLEAYLNSDIASYYITNAPGGKKLNYLDYPE